MVEYNLSIMYLTLLFACKFSYIRRDGMHAEPYPRSCPYLTLCVVRPDLFFYLLKVYCPFYITFAA